MELLSVRRPFFLLLNSMAKIAGIQTINNPETGRVEKLVIDIDKALKNKQMSSIIEDLLDHMAIVKAKKTEALFPGLKQKNALIKSLALNELYRCH